MSTGALLIIIIVVVIVVAAVVVAGMAAARRRRLQRRFGPEYDRAVGEHGSQLKAESELAGRERRIRSLEIRPLSDTARANYASSWRTIQEQFVDQPENSVVKAQALVTTVMRDRGYPIEGHDQMLADLSVEHANTLEQYRLAHTISQSAAQGQASTEDLRQAMIKYRALFSDLLGGEVAPDGSIATRAGAAPDGAAPDGVAPDGVAPGGVAPDGVGPDGDLAGQSAEAPIAGRTEPAAEAPGMDPDAEMRPARDTGPAADVSAVNADPAGAGPAGADPAGADPAAAGSATAGVPAEESGRAPAWRKRR
jgi:Tfp pilus assembly protein PilX